jgi:hypothetical protein
MPNENDLSGVQISHHCRDRRHFCHSKWRNGRQRCTKQFMTVATSRQNAPCKGDGGDPAELKERIAADQIESKSGICNFLSITPEPYRLKAIWSVIFGPGRSSAFRCLQVLGFWTRTSTMENLRGPGDRAEWTRVVWSLASSKLTRSPSSAMLFVGASLIT